MHCSRASTRNLARARISASRTSACRVSAYRVWAALLGLVTVTGWTPVVHAEATSIVFAAGPDDTGTVGRIVEAFNAAHPGKIQVRWQQMPRDNNQHHQQLIAELEKGAGPDVFASDVIWTAELARKGLITDATRRFYADFKVDMLLEPALQSATHRLRIWGVPWYADVSLLYYRKDLLAKSGFDAPPKTWSDLQKVAQKVMKEANVPYGFVFQGARYEGGAANALEFIWSAGGRALVARLTNIGAFGASITEMPSVQIATPQAARGFDIAHGLVQAGVTPRAVTSFREKETLQAFADGKAVFMRNWPYAAGILRTSSLKPDQIGLAAIPAASANRTGYSCLGGWNLMIRATADPKKQAAAWTFIRYLTSDAVQKRQAVEAGLLPVLAKLYDDRQIQEAVPALAVGREVLSSRIRVRPASPFYAALSDQIADAFVRVLEGKIDGAAATEILEKQLRTTALRNK